MKHVFYDILGCATNNKTLDCEQLKDISREQWYELYHYSKQQGVTALLFAQIKDLPKHVAPPKELAMQWMAHTMSIEQQTKTLYKKSAEFARLMAEEGLHTMTLKGLALCGYYPNPWHREYGDLDCYLFEYKEGKISWDLCYERGNIASERVGVNVERDFYKHSHIHFKGLEIENHQFALPIKDGQEVRDLEKELRRTLQIGKELKHIGNTELVRPTADFMALFLVAHSMSHFLFEGIKMRHILDWALFVKAEHENVDWDNFWKWCDRMKFSRFVKCLNYICKHHLGMQLPKYLMQKEDITASLSERILDDTLVAYSLYTQGYKGLFFRFVLIGRYLKSLWKFQTVHQRNAIWLLLRRVKNYWKKDIKLD